MSSVGATPSCKAASGIVSPTNSPAATANELPSCHSTTLSGVGSSFAVSSASPGSRSRSRRGDCVRPARSHRSRRHAKASSAASAVTRCNAPHIPLLAGHAMSWPVLLEPYPNAAILSLCVVGDVLVTTHRTGVRLYKAAAAADDAVTAERTASVSGASHTDSTPQSSAQGEVWCLAEVRDGVQLQDAYLTCAARVPAAAAQSSPYARYFGVAAGSDRTLHSVCVLSTRGHFTLHHELHGRNRVVCMHLAAIATAPLQPHPCVPLLVSVDEVGEVVLYDVQRRSAVRLQRHSSLSDNITPDVTTSTTVTAWEEAVLARLRSDTATTQPYRLESGVATRVVLLGPCTTLCPHCHNTFGGDAVSGPESPYMALSLFLTSRAPDVGRGDDAAELHVSFLRVLWNRHVAWVLQEEDVVRETAPVKVCERGVALCVWESDDDNGTTPSPATVLLARPRLRVWRLSGCTGRHLQTLRLYDDDEASGDGSRAPHEYFMDWHALGAHVPWRNGTVSSQLDSCRGDGLHPIWHDGVAAVTEENTVLWLGAQDVRRALAKESDGDTALTDGALERRRLDTWLDASAVTATTSAAPDATRRMGRTWRVLTQLYPTVAAVRDGPRVTTTMRAPDQTHGAVHVLCCARARVLLLYCDATETLLRVPLSPSHAAVVDRVSNSHVTHTEKRESSTTRASLSRMLPTLDFSLVRPLATAVLRWTDPLSSAAPENTTVVDAAPTCVSRSTAASEVGPGTESDDAPRTTSPEAVRIRVRDTPSRHGSHTRRADVVAAATSSVPVAAHTDAVRRQVCDLVADWAHDVQARHATVDTAYYDAVTRLRELVVQAEPRARQALLHAWQDGHDALYIRRSVALEQVRMRVARRDAARRALCVRCERHVWDDLVADERSVRCVTQFLALRAERHRTRNHRGLFDFARYFTTATVPPTLHDLHERDRCTFELADLQLRQRAELAALDPDDVVTLYQNEEWRATRVGGRLGWQPHPTFAVDDEGGGVIDLNAYNACATRDDEVAGTWVWAEEGVGCDTSTSRTRVLVRELQRWNVGPWMYAVQWPERHAETPDTEEWTREERVGCRVRRRRLTRRRVNVAVRAVRERLAAVHAQQLEALRLELNL